MAKATKIAGALSALIHPIADLTLDPGNVNTHDDRGIEVIGNSLKRFGQMKPIVAQKKGKKLIVRAGEGTVLAAKSLGWTEIAVMVKTMSDKEGEAYALVDNRSSDLSEWDKDALHELLNTWDEDAAAALGFSEEELEELLGPETSQEGWRGPTLDPAIGGHAVTDADVAKTGEELNSRYSEGQALQEVTCPHCAESFHIQQ